MVVTPVCPRHGHELQVVEEGDLNGTLVRWWGDCPDERRRGNGPVMRCAYEVRIEEPAGEQPGLFG